MSYSIRSRARAISLWLSIAAIAVATRAQDTKYVQRFSSYYESTILPPPCLSFRLLDEFKADTADCPRHTRRMAERHHALESGAKNSPRIRWFSL